MFEHGLQIDSVSDWHSRATDLLGRITHDPLLARLTAGPDTSHLEEDWRTWVPTLFPHAACHPFAPHHAELWDWAWSIERGARARPFVAVWPRGGAKSTTAEMAVIALGARRVRRYCLYVSGTQELADKHVAEIASRLESDTIARWYPALGDREIGKYGSPRGWRRNRLRTAGGYTVDSIGLDTAVRGIKVDDVRPDTIVIDDVDHVHDSPGTVQRKIETLTQSILPAGSTDLAVLAVQNLIHRESIFSRLAGVASMPADFLAGRTVSGPHPAIRDLVTEQEDGRAVITAGAPLWEGQDLEACQHAIDTYGLTAFLRESQHEVDEIDGGMFGAIEFRHCRHNEVPDLIRTTTWVDPAVTDTDHSDSHGIQIDGLAPDGTIYRLWSWEHRASPERALTLAIIKAVEYGSLKVGVETDQGGDTWRALYGRLIRDYEREGLTLDGVTYRLPAGKRAPVFDEAKAGSGHGGKAERASRMLMDYERGRFIHVIGTHATLERALRRFLIVKPYDLADVAYWAWNDLAGPGGPSANRFAVSAPRPLHTGYQPR